MVIHVLLALFTVNKKKEEEEDRCNSHTSAPWPIS
jgi:hypothetical protein